MFAFRKKYRILEEHRKKLSEDHRRKIGLANKGKHSSPNTEFKKGHHHSEETKLKISQLAKERFLDNPEYRKNLILLHIGKKHSQKSREKMSLSHMGIHSGNKHPLYGRHHTKEAKLKMSISKKGQKAGNKHHNWKGGIGRLPYPFEFNSQLKEQIRKRDNYRCQGFRHQDELRDKNNRKISLSIHHIDYQKSNNNPNNLISLCNPCHVQTNYDRENWINYYKSKLNSRERG